MHFLTGDKYQKSLAENIRLIPDKKKRTYVSVLSRIAPYNLDRIFTKIRNNQVLSYQEHEAFKGAMYTLFVLTTKYYYLRRGQPMDIYTLDFYQVVKHTDWTALKFCNSFSWFVLPFICIVGYREMMNLDLVSVYEEGFKKAVDRTNVSRLLIGDVGRGISKIQKVYKNYTTSIDPQHKEETSLEYMKQELLDKSNKKLQQIRAEGKKNSVYWNKDKIDKLFDSVNILSNAIPSLTKLQRTACAYTAEYLQDPYTDPRLTEYIRKYGE